MKSDSEDRTGQQLPRYREFLSFVFERRPAEIAQERNEALEAGEDSAVFEARPEDVVALYTYLLEQDISAFQRFDEGTAAAGIDVLFNNSFDDLIFARGNPTVAAEVRTRAILAIKNLYSGVFEKRCLPILSHLDERPTSRLNSVCYMLWDVCPLGHVSPDTENASQSEIGAILEVLEFALQSSNDACIESALHGLGHYQHLLPAAVEDIVSRFVADRTTLRRELIAYAGMARIGRVL